ncbi:hypothetical protein [Bradyrhizobium sp. F1.13.3]|uniref:hypothetical protein n=1 Tax=Bradyrhizobium sp. F1.13.3 TaxID=3156351 RepID=UPI003399167F
MTEEPEFVAMRLVSGYRRDYSGGRVFVLVATDACHAFKAAEIIAGSQFNLHFSGPVYCAVPGDALNRLFLTDAELLAAVPDLPSPTRIETPRWSEP